MDENSPRVVGWTFISLGAALYFLGAPMSWLRGYPTPILWWLLSLILLGLFVLPGILVLTGRIKVNLEKKVK